ncbi:cytochrome C [Sulfuricaulis limicola]|uniref:Cytochrome C n=1 Tax=Sulfuricaulis limicola TaxID=1620215 RepID=A0A1B4XFR5_9GAMM|nr:cytochrome c [Sulfuricaulis limicola]BAV33648.1 cytochrome C [Sulfuricaulis limicola]
MLAQRHAAVMLWLAVATAPAMAANADTPPGEYLFRAAGCAGCHTDADSKGTPLAGGRALSTPFGTFYSPNITPDPDTGIGRWSEADFVRALREGISPQGQHYYPAFPYTSYTQLTDADLRALWAYLHSVKPVRQANKPHALPWYLRSRATLRIWKMMFFGPGAYELQHDKPPAWNRGAYLVRAVAHCGECHTPRNLLGGFRQSQQLAGNPHGVDDAKIPNITPDRKTGIGTWTANDLVYYLETGATPDGDFAGDAMAEIIDNSTSQLTGDDRRAIAVYIKSLPAVETERLERARKEKPPKKKEAWE